MYDAAIIPSKHQLITVSSDDLGHYGSVFAPESDSEIPQPLKLYVLELADNSDAVRLK